MTYKSKLSWADVTPKETWLNRRQIMAGFAAGAGVAALGSIAAPARAETAGAGLTLTDKADATSYNNYYEFGTGKGDPVKYAHTLNTDGWSVEIGGMVEKPGTYALGDLIQGLDIEERIYRFRCVEAWSMVVPWNGFELGALLKKVGVQSGAKYVAFETANRPDEMPGLRSRILDWPYREGLRLDEAMHPLTMIATGIYGEDLPKQNGAPLRLVVPWKYGFKSIKSIVKITLTDQEPFASWNAYAASEYGFYSNVNPNVSHPRWSQAKERVLGASLFDPKVPTLMFNGYEDEVAGLYAGMDLKTYF